MDRKTLIQFAHPGKQIACFIRLFAGANYDKKSKKLFNKFIAISF